MDEVTKGMVKAAVDAYERSSGVRVESAAMRAAIRAAAKAAGAAASPEFFLPLSLVRLADPNHDPGQRIVMDADTAYIGTISSNLAEAAVRAINAAGKLAAPERSER